MFGAVHDVAMAVWSPFSENGLLSNPSEWHALIVGVMDALMVITLHRRGYRRMSMGVVFASFLAALMLSANGIAYKTWYFGGPFTAITTVYLLVLNRRTNATGIRNR